MHALYCNSIWYYDVICDTQMEKIDTIVSSATYARICPSVPALRLRLIVITITKVDGSYYVITRVLECLCSTVTTWY